MRKGADSWVAAPSTSASVSMVYVYSASWSSATCAPTFFSNVTSPSASSRRIASRTGTTLMSSSPAICPSTSRKPETYRPSSMRSRIQS